jgi:hypothetical protein
MNIFIDKKKTFAIICASFTTSGRNSAVECYLAKVDVDGSNPFARSSQQRRHSQVAKAAVCKTVIHRFESGCRLQIMDLGAARSIVQPLSLFPVKQENPPLSPFYKGGKRGICLIQHPSYCTLAPGPFLIFHRSLATGHLFRRPAANMATFLSGWAREGRSAPRRAFPGVSGGSRSPA